MNRQRNESLDERSAAPSDGPPQRHRKSAALRRRALLEIRERREETPLTATLHATLRGAPIYPAPDATVHVYAYPADLVENVSDYSATPAILQGVMVVPPFQTATDYEVDVSSVVGAALFDGRLSDVLFEHTWTNRPIERTILGS